MSARVIQMRIKERVIRGDGENSLLARRIRAFGNFAEYAPLMIGMLVIAELSNMSAIWLHVLGIMALLGRVLHGASYFDSWNIAMHFKLRQPGMILSLTSLGLGAIMLLIYSF